MEPVDKFVLALALTESNNNPHAPSGDGGRAAFRFQTHPDWLWEWANNYKIQPHVNETWDSFVTRVVCAFVEDHLNRGWLAVNLAMYFHLGHLTKPEDEDWDQHYATRFSQHLLST